MGLHARKPVLGGGVANNKGADHGNWLLENIISALPTSEISIFYIVSVAEQAGLSMTWSETQRQVFTHRGPYAVVFNIFVFFYRLSLL